MNNSQHVPATISLNSAALSGKKSISSVLTMSESAGSSIGRPVGSTEEKKSNDKEEVD